MSETTDFLKPIKKRDGFTYGILKDKRPDKRGLSIDYRTIKLKDGREWMAENFRFFVSQEKSITWHDEYGSPNPEKNKGYGLFYNWDSIQELLPEGWRLPTIDEWKNLVHSYGGPNNAYEALVLGGSSGLDLQLLSWRAGDHYTTSEQLGEEGFFWSGSEGDDNRSAALIKLNKASQSTEVVYLMKYTFFTVRLIKEV